MATLLPQQGAAHEGGPKYEVNVEGTVYDWDRNEVTPSELRALAGIPQGTPMEVIDLQTNVQRTLAETEVITLKPGLGFSKKTQFRRG